MCDLCHDGAQSYAMSIARRSVLNLVRSAALGFALTGSSYAAQSSFSDSTSPFGAHGQEGI